MIKANEGQDKTQKTATIIKSTTETKLQGVSTKGLCVNESKSWSSVHPLLGTLNVKFWNCFL